MLTVRTKTGRKSIHLPYEALDEVRKIVYNNDRIIEYSICICDYERMKNVEFLEGCN
tara:strand:+ start:978 stop:1148 length:171 start_codon:yes stop_codon:yes gene_type:complete